MGTKKPEHSRSASACLHMAATGRNWHIDVVVDIRLTTASWMMRVSCAATSESTPGCKRANVGTRGTPHVVPERARRTFQTESTCYSLLGFGKSFLNDLESEEGMAALVSTTLVRRAPSSRSPCQSRMQPLANLAVTYHVLCYLNKAFDLLCCCRMDGGGGRLPRGPWPSLHSSQACRQWRWSTTVSIL